MIQNLKPLFGNLALFAKQKMGFDYPPKLFLKQDAENSNKALGKTAYYDPQKESITLYVTGRHPKDVLRSFAHELVHHTQNLRGDLSPEKIKSTGKNYAQECPHMRKMEEEAYLKGNMCFRDWEDNLEDKDMFLIKLAESKFLKEKKKMTTRKANILKEQESQEDIVALGRRAQASIELGIALSKAKMDGVSKEEATAMVNQEYDPEPEKELGLEDLFNDGDSGSDYKDDEPPGELKLFDPVNTKKRTNIGTEIPESKNLKRGKTMKKKITEKLLREKINNIIIEQLTIDPDSRPKPGTTKDLEVGPGLPDTMEPDLEISAIQDAVKDEVRKGATREEIMAMIDAVLSDPNLPSDTDSENQFKDDDDAMVAPKGPNESNEIFAPNHYCIHHGGVQHEGKIVAAEAIQHVEPDENGFISHYDMKLSDGTILEDVAAEDIQITNATLESSHGSKSGAGKRDHKPMKKKKTTKLDGGVGADDSGTGKEAKKAEKDHDGDGKIESGTDEYLGSRDRAIKAAMAKKKTKKESKIQTPEQENTLYEQRFTPKNNRLFEKLLKEWTK